MRPRYRLPICLLLLLCLAVIAPAAAAPAPRPASQDAIVQKYRDLIPRLMAEQDVPGLAVVVVDETRVLWVEGFGTTDHDRKTPVTPDTIFSVQSTSKTFTAVATMIAVQEGLVDLDAPITTYLPGFTVRSIFEEHPEDRITLRRLLSHTTGIPHEGLVGNNYDLGPVTLEAHALSLADAWLRFPVGTGYAYSNAGYGLVGYTLQVVSGRPFAEYVEERLLRPLGMVNSTFDIAQVRQNPNRAVGHAPPLPDVPLEIPIVPEGGLYTSANDMARFLQFQLNRGTVEGRRVLDPALLDQMYTVQFPAGAPVGYALGVARERRPETANADILAHGGGGFGFLSDMLWYPELGIGIAVLTNSIHDFQWTLANQILDDFIHEPGSPYAARLAALPTHAPAQREDQFFIPPAGLANTIAGLTQPTTDAGRARWAGYAGTYRVSRWGRYGGAYRVWEQGDSLYIAPEGGEGLRLAEVQPGVFYATDGNVLDFTRPVPAWQDIQLEKVQAAPAPWQLAVLGGCGLIFLSALVAYPVRGVIGLVRRRRGEGARPGSRGRLGPVLALLTSLLGLLCLAMLAGLPFLLYSGFMGNWNLPLPQRIGLHLPLALAVVTCAQLLGNLPAWRNRWWSPGERVHYALLTLAGVALVLLLNGWHLVGLGV